MKRERLEATVYLELVRTSEALMHAFAQLFKEHGLTDPQYNALRILRGADGPLPVYTIGERMASAQPDVTRLVDRLEAAGLVARTPCPEDRRVKWVKLTRKGAAILKKLDGPVQELHRSQLGHLSQGELAQFRDLLAKTRENRSAE